MSIPRELAAACADVAAAGHADSIGGRQAPSQVLMAKQDRLSI